MLLNLRDSMNYIDPAPPSTTSVTSYYAHAWYKCTTRLIGSLAVLRPNTNCVFATLPVCLAKTGETPQDKFKTSPVSFSEYLCKPLNQRSKKGTRCFGLQVFSLKLQYKKADALSCWTGERATNKYPKLFQMINRSFGNKNKKYRK